MTEEVVTEVSATMSPSKANHVQVSPYMDEIVRNESIAGTPQLSCPQYVDLAPWEKWFTSMQNVAQFFKVQPTKYSKNKKLLVLASKRDLFLFYLLTGIYSIDIIYLIYISKFVVIETVGEKEFWDFWAHTSTRIVAGNLAVIMCFDLTATMRLMNALMLTRRVWRDKFGGFGEDFTGPLERRLRRILQAGGVFAIIQPVFPLLMHLGSRDSYRYWGAHILPESIYNSVPGVIFFAANDVIFSIFAIQNSLYMATVIVSYFVLMKFWTTSLMGKVLRRRTLESNTPLFQYRCLLTFGRISNCCIGKTVIPYIIFASSLVISGILSYLIRKGNQAGSLTLVNMLVGIVLLSLCLYTMISSAGHMVGRSRMLLSVLKRERDLYRRKYIKSTREVRVYAGSFFHVTELTVMTCTKWTVDNAITIIFTL